MILELTQTLPWCGCRGAGHGGVGKLILIAWVWELAWVKENWQNHSHKISVTWGNSRIAERSLSEGPVLMLQQKPGAMNQINNSLK